MLVRTPSGTSAKGLQTMHDEAALLLARSQFAFTLGLPLHLPELPDRARQLPRGARRAVAEDAAAASTSICSATGSRSSRSTSRWASCRASSCPTSSAPTGRSSPTRRGRSIGPLMAYEVLTAFFLEAGFLGVMLFGMKKVGPGPALLRHLHGGARHLHLGLLDHRGQQLDADAAGLRRSTRAASSCRPDHGWPIVIFNPSFPYRLVHTRDRLLS